MDGRAMHDTVARFTLLLQYLFDASEAEGWMGEHELYMMSEERARDEQGADNMLKKHANLETVVDDYADTVKQLGEASRQFTDANHPDRSWRQALSSFCLVSECY